MTNVIASDNTEVSGKAVVTLDVPMSPLLHESSERKLFADFFSSTWTGVSQSGDLFAESFSATSTERYPSGAHFAEPGAADWSTPLSSESHAYRFRRPHYSAEPVEVDPLAKATDDRVQLLARKYVAKDKFSEEEDARLAIVTERVRKLLPAVTVQEFEALERVLTSLRDVSASNAGMREKLRLARSKNA